MVIEKIEIEGFGIYIDFLRENLKKEVNIILGNNEAGKTTLLHKSVKVEFLKRNLNGYLNVLLEYSQGSSEIKRLLQKHIKMLSDITKAD